MPSFKIRFQALTLCGLLLSLIAAIPAHALSVHPSQLTFAQLSSLQPGGYNSFSGQVSWSPLGLALGQDGRESLSLAVEGGILKAYSSLSPFAGAQILYGINARQPGSLEYRVGGGIQKWFMTNPKISIWYPELSAEAGWTFSKPELFGIVTGIAFRYTALVTATPIIHQFILGARCFTW